MTKQDFIKAHPVGNWCAMPKSGREIPILKFGKLDVPLRCDNRQYCTAIEDQGALPHCAAYTAAAFAENILWRRDGKITQVEPVPLYNWAKKHDGNPTGDGTTLHAAAGALLARGIFDKRVCAVKSVGRALDAVDTDDVRATIHRFGCFLGGFNITDEWYDLKEGGKTAIVGESGRNTLGGHAVLVCGYDTDGVWVENSWGDKWGVHGFGYMLWSTFKRQFMYGVALTHVLDGFK